jgi:hypothetical protein
MPRIGTVTSKRFVEFELMGRLIASPSTYTMIVANETRRTQLNWFRCMHLREDVFEVLAHFYSAFRDGPNRQDASFAN